MRLDGALKSATIILFNPLMELKILFSAGKQGGRKKERKKKNEIIEPARAENCFFEILIEFL